MADFDPRPAPKRIDLANEPGFELGGVRVHPSELEVEAKGQRHGLQPRVMRVLVALAKARPAVVSRETLIEQCWDGRIVGDDAINRCILALRHLADEFTPAPFAIETMPRIGHRLVEKGKTPKAASRAAKPKRWRSLTVAAVLLLVAAGLVLVRRAHWPWDGPASRTVLVTAAANDAASRELARAVAAKLASFQPIQSASIRLFGDAQGGSASPDLTLQVSRIAGTPIGASLVLTSGRAILWSRDFEQASGNIADLQQQVAITAALVLRCADEATGSADRLSEQTLKGYLGACIDLADSASNSAETAGILQRVVRSAPRFKKGWARLLAADTKQLDSSEGSEAVNARAVLRRHIAAARRFWPDLAEAYLAEARLQPDTEFLIKERLVKVAVAHDPSSAAAHLEYAMFLENVGRLGAAVRESRVAVTLDPLSPTVRDIYMTELAIAGRPDAARAALSEAERLSPGAASLTDNRYRFNLRFGDAREALRMLRSGEVDYPGAKIQTVFLEARIDPSPDKVNEAIEKARIVAENIPGAIDGPLQTLAEFNRKDEIFQLLLDTRGPHGMDQITGVVFRPAFAEVLRDRRFMQVADRIGLLSYWRTTDHWPDFCFAPDLPYDCKAEGARVARHRI